MRKDIVIFGAGEWGKLAYYYYKDKCNIVCFLDNDKRIWGTEIGGVPVFSPDYLQDKTVSVVVANKRFQSQILNQLSEQYGISEVIIFELIEKIENLYKCEEDYNVKHELIIEFRDGLGNQMFQYALYKSLESVGRNIKADISEYSKPWMMPFFLEKVFPRIKLKKASPYMKDYYKNMGLVYDDLSTKREDKLIYDKSLYEMEEGCICGWHVSYMYAEKIKEELYEIFEFDIEKYPALKKMIDKLKNKNTVSVQVRRGDFLSAKFYRELGCHCTEDYYKKALNIISNKVVNPIYVFISDDIEWVKQTFSCRDAIYIEEKMFDEYYDWFDMCIMSKCKHNIIANSTFGWWGAWLNQNPDKIVMTPKRWRTNWDFLDFCPPEWIRI